MADENSLLGTSGKEAIPFEYQVEEQKIARRRNLAKQMLALGSKPQGPNQMFGLHMANPGITPHIAQALQMFLGQKDLAGADEQQQAMMQRMSAQRAGDQSAVSDLANGKPGQPFTIPANEMDSMEAPGMTKGQAPDPRAAIARAMASGFGDIRAQGTQMQKDRQAAFLEQSKILGNADPVAAANRLGSGSLETPVQPLTPLQPEFIKGPDNSTWAVTRDNKGTKPTATPVPVGTTITNDLRQGSKVDEEAAKWFNYGGEGYKKGESANTSLANNVNLLNTLATNPQMGAGAEGFQVLRKWAETLGAPFNPATTPTEIASMQLGQKTLDRLGGLGAQVSDSDRKFMLAIQGNLGNDPEAVRKMLLLETKYLMQIQSKINRQAKEVADRHGTTLPTHEFKYNFGKKDADDLESLFMNGGFPAVKPPVAAVPPGRLKRAGR